MYAGQPRGKDYKRSVGFVIKDDCHLATLTVYETLYFSARMRVSDAIPDNVVAFRVRLVMKLMGMAVIS